MATMSESRRTISRSALAPRRNALAAVTSAVAAVALAAAVAGRSCSVDDNAPEGVVRDFAAAADADDREALYELLGPETRARLEAAAKRATDLVGGSQRYSALDMISVGRSSETPPPKDFVLEERGEERAVVVVIGASGERARVTVVRVNGRWLIELPDYGSSL